MTRRAETFLLFAQAVGILTTSYIDKIPPDGQVVLYLIAALHLAAAIAAFFWGGPFHRGGHWMWVWIGAAVLMPLVIALLIPIGEYGSSPACVQLCGYPSPPLMFLAFYPWVSDRHESLRPAVNVLTVVVVIATPLIIMATMYQVLTWDNWLSWINTTALTLVACIGGLAFGAVCRAAARETIAAQSAHADILDELHDNVETALLGIAGQQERGDQSAVQNMLRTLSDSVRQKRHRAMSAQENLSLAYILAAQVANVRDLVRVDVPHVGGLTVRQPIATFIGRAIGALLKNVVEHSGAEHVSIRVRIAGDRLLIIEVVDDGEGFDQAIIETRRTSLHGLRERARRLGGDLDEIASEQPGACVRVWLPLHPER